MKKVLFFFAVLVFVKILISYSFPSPWVFGDAAVFTSKTRAIIENGNFNYDQYHFGWLNVPPLYSIILLPAYISHNPEINHRIILVINIILTSSIIFPVYLLGRKFLSENEAALTALFSSTYPSMFGYSFTVMSENLFLPLFLLSALLLHKTYTSNKISSEFLLGLVLGALFLTRTAGIFPIIAWIIYTFFAVWQERDRINFLKRKLIVIVGLIFSVSWWYLVKEPAPSGGFSGYQIGDYVQTALSIASNLPDFIKSLSLAFNQMSFLIIGTLFLPTALIIGSLFFNDLSMRMVLKRLKPVLFFCLFTIVLFFGFSVTHQFIFSQKIAERYMVFGRYVEAVAPLLITIASIIIFSINAKLVFWKKCGLVVVFVVMTGISILHFPIAYYDIVNNIPILYFRGVDFVQNMPWIWIVIFAISILFLLFPTHFFKRFIVMLLIFISIYNYIPAYKLASDVSVAKKDEAAGAVWIYKNLPRDSIIGFDQDGLWEKNTIQDYWLYEFWLGRNYHLKIANPDESITYFVSTKKLPFQQIYSDKRMIIYKK
ncbi:MAG: glycosyltransferase family 39 protein [Patescibacteria group bacterium]